MSEERDSYRVIYHGAVQGVGFRYTVWTLSKGFPVNGYVKNLSDGTVEMFAICSAEVFKRFDSAIRNRFDGNISSVDITESDDKVETFTKFEILR